MILKGENLLPEIVFIEGVSGVGKSTMVKTLAGELRRLGYSVRDYVEFDYTNPIDFYCTAYLLPEQYEKLCRDYPLSADIIRANTIPAGKAKLVRYFDEDTPLFEEPLLSELALCEFCYKPKQLVPIEEYSSAYREVWRQWVSMLDKSCDFFLFDGSLLHHPINDMMRNYGVDGEGALPHVRSLLDSLGDIKRHIFYLKTGNIRGQLKRAYRDRGQDTPAEEQIRFWESRYENDRTVLRGISEEYEIFDVSAGNWVEVRKEILNRLT